MNKLKNYILLKKFSQEQGVDLFGVADISKIKKEFYLSETVLEKVDRAVCLGIRLSEGILDGISNEPNRLYSYHYRTMNLLLDQVALKISNNIQNKGYYALPIPASQIVDWNNQTAQASHKKIGVLAGVGWIGRNNLLVNKKLGSQFRLVSILTNMPLKTDKPTKEDCGLCRMCVNICPAGAIKEDPSDFDHIKCFEKLKEFHKKSLVDQYICGVCVRVCNGRKK